jgi:hypothetical protein
MLTHLAKNAKENREKAEMPVAAPSWVIKHKTYYRTFEGDCVSRPVIDGSSATSDNVHYV